MEAFFTQLFRLPLKTSEKGMCLKLAKNVFVWDYVKIYAHEREVEYVAMSVSKKERVRLRRKIK